MSYLIAKLVVSVCCLSSILGEEKDFLDSAKNKEITKEAFTPSEKDDKLRPARQSLSFSSFQPFAPRPASDSGMTEGISFQRIRMGPEEPQSNRFRSRSLEGLSDAARPRLTLNDLDFNGFEFNQPFTSNSLQQPLEDQNSRNRFQNFQTVTEPSRLRNVQPTIPSSQITQFPNFQQNQIATQPPRSRFTNFNLPPNRDPRRRNRVQPSVANEAPRFQSNQATFSAAGNFQQNSFPDTVVNNRRRQRFRTVTRVPSTRAPVTRTTVPRVPTTRPSTTQFTDSTEQTVSFQPQNSVQESVRSFQKSDRSKEEKEKNSLIDNCLKEAIKHAREIEELENRTSLHIEYAQEKQLEIVHLEETLEALKNESKLQTEKISNLGNKIKNLTTLLETKDTSISKLKDDISKLEESFEKEELKKHETIQDLNEKLETTTIELAKTKISLNSQTKENKVTEAELTEAMSKIEKFKKEKENLLKIVQQLAEIGNPSLNFNTFSVVTNNEEFEEFEDYKDYEEVHDYDHELNTLENEYFAVDTSEPEGSGALA
jgi:hypothetical protein